MYSNKVAVLAGDYLLARASVLLARLENTAVVQIMATALESLVAGEIMQLKALFVLGAAAAASASASSVIVDDSAQPLLSEDIVSSVNSNPHSTWKASRASTSLFSRQSREPLSLGPGSWMRLEARSSQTFWVGGMETAEQIGVRVRFGLLPQLALGHKS